MAKTTIVMPVDMLRKRSNEWSSAGRQQGNYASGAENNVDQKLNLLFACESRDTKSFTLFITAKTIGKQKQIKTTNWK